MYLYETHLHTSPVSRCARASVRDTVEFYKAQGYAGIFLTNHYVEPHRDPENLPTFESRIELLFSDYEQAVEIGKEIGLSVFFGVEITHAGTDFLVYGLDKTWWLSHPQIEEMQIRDRLTFLAENGALIIHAHPYRESHYIECIRLFPRYIHGVEIYNANRTPLENEMAALYAEKYQLLTFAGSDNHSAGVQKKFGGLQFASPLKDEQDFVQRFKNGEATLFIRENA